MRLRSAVTLALAATTFAGAAEAASAAKVVARDQGSSQKLKIAGWNVSLERGANHSLARGLSELGRARLIPRLRWPNGKRKRDRNSCIAEYRRRRALLQFTTLAGVPPGKNGCQARRRVVLSYAIFSSRRWRTDRGLRIGQTLARLKELYPEAERGRSWMRRPRGKSWWLLSKISPFADNPEVPVLEARVKRGRVRHLILHVGAQGE